MHGLSTLVNDNHMDNYLKVILAFVYHGSIVNIQPKNDRLQLSRRTYTNLAKEMSQFECLWYWY